MDDVIEVFSRHKTGILQYSGGKDSTACLYLLREYWPRLTVVWVNTGDAYPETLDRANAVSEEVSKAGGNFLEIKSDVIKHNSIFGIPTDLVPADNTPLGKALIRDKDSIPLQGRYECCAANIWVPLQNMMVELKPTLIIRGVRHDERYRPSIIKNCNGIEYYHPIYSWTEDRVLSFLTDIGKLPRNYKYTKGSLDCMHCTAFWHELEEGKLAYLKEYHPDVYETVNCRLTYIIKVSIRNLLRLKELADG